MTDIEKANEQAKLTATFLSNLGVGVAIAGSLTPAIMNQAHFSYWGGLGFLLFGMALGACIHMLGRWWLSRELK